MSGPGHPQDPDARMARLVAGVLRGGVALAALVTLAGGILLLVQQGAVVPDYHAFRGANAPYRTLPEIGRGVGGFSPAAIVALGVVLLIATPIARVLITLIGFIARRDRVYIALTGLVLVILIYSLGFAGGG